MMFRIVWSVHAFTLRSYLHERNMPAMKWGLKVLQPVPALWSQQACPWNKSLLLCDLGFQFCILSLVSFFFFSSPFLLLCPHPNLVCLLCAVAGCHLLFLFWGMREPRRGHRFIAFNFVKRQIKLSCEECSTLLIWFYVCGGSYPYGVRTLPSGLTSHEVKKSYAWNINLILY